MRRRAARNSVSFAAPAREGEKDMYPEYVDGLAVQADKVDEPDGNAGEVLLAQAAAHAADLLVMGSTDTPSARAGVRRSYPARPARGHPAAEIPGCSTLKTIQEGALP